MATPESKTATTRGKPRTETFIRSPQSHSKSLKIRYGQVTLRREDSLGTRVRREPARLEQGEEERAPLAGGQARAQWRRIADQHRPKAPKLAILMDDAEPNVLTYMSFPPQHRAKLHSTNPLVPTCGHPRH